MRQIFYEQWRDEAEDEKESHIWFGHLYIVGTHFSDGCALLQRFGNWFRRLTCGE